MISLDQFKVKVVSDSETYGVFEIGPLPLGFGNTLGNSLRRLLLSSIDGAAVTGVKINGVKHEYSTIEGVQDDVMTVLLRIKELAFRIYSDEPQTLRLQVKGKKSGVTPVVGGDFSLTSDVELVNPEMVITHLTKDVSLDVEITVEKGIGYAYANEDKRKEIGVLPIDSIYSPVKRVQVDIVQARLGQDTNLDQVNLQVYTNGTIKPSEALLRAGEIYDELANRLLQMLGGDPESAEAKIKAEVKTVVETPKVPLNELNLSTRLTNALLNAGITDLTELSQRSRDEVINFRGMGRKSITELDEVMNTYGINFAG